MSFGFSAGDLINAANLTYRLIQALQGSHDAGEDYRAAIHELGCMQQAFIRVSCLGKNQNVSQATFDSASYIVMGSIDVIESFLAKTKKYEKRLGGLGAPGIAQNLRKVGWTLYKADDMKKLRETLHKRLTAVNVLLVAANLDPNGAGNVAKYLESDERPVSERISVSGTSKDSTQPEITHSASTSRATKPVSAKVSQPTVLGIGNEEEILTANTQNPTTTMEAPLEHNTTCTPDTHFSLTMFSQKQLALLITDAFYRSVKINEIAELLRTLIQMGECQLDPSECEKLTSQLDNICGERIPFYNHEKGSIKFKDAISRKFAFPWDLCHTWKGMEEMIKQAFLHVDEIGPHVQKGCYDLVGADGEIIRPQEWESTIRPDWTVTMHMWPIHDPPLPPPPVQFPSAAVSDHQTPLEGLQTPPSPSLTGTSATNTEFPLSPESVQFTQLGSQMSRTSISDEDVVEE